MGQRETRQYGEEAYKPVVRAKTWLRPQYLLEQYSYRIEVRAGVDHANADTLCRIPCNGKIYICEKSRSLREACKNLSGRGVHGYSQIASNEHMSDQVHALLEPGADR